MKFMLFVEGETEKKALPRFLKHWLDPQLGSPVSVKAVQFKGWAKYDKDVGQKAQLYLQGYGHEEVIAVIGLLDLYGPDIYPRGITSASERVRWATKHFEQKVGHQRFRQFFAVHETEAWLLSQPELFSRRVRSALPQGIQNPESVDFDKPPSRRLNDAYKQGRERAYKKVVDGYDLFEKLDPATACGKCPNLKLLLDEMLRLAKQAEL
ncbi:MAG: DUF4276 family protein [bacterium]|nr:DUF4276 family protein [bacterium]